MTPAKSFKDPMNTMRSSSIPWDKNRLPRFATSNYVGQWVAFGRTQASLAVGSLLILNEGVVLSGVSGRGTLVLEVVPDDMVPSRISPVLDVDPNSPDMVPSRIYAIALSSLDVVPRCRADFPSS